MKAFVEISAQEAATVLTALRAWQVPNRTLLLEYNYFEEYQPLESEEIDELCERINNELGVCNAEA